MKLHGLPKPDWGIIDACVCITCQQVLGVNEQISVHHRYHVIIVGKVLQWPAPNVPATTAKANTTSATDTDNGETENVSPRKSSPDAPSPTPPA